MSVFGGFVALHTVKPHRIACMQALHTSASIMQLSLPSLLIFTASAAHGCSGLLMQCGPPACMRIACLVCMLLAVYHIAASLVT